MARNPVSGKAAPAEAAVKEASKPVDPRRRAVDALMNLAATRPWDEIELPDIASEAGLTLAQFLVDRDRPMFLFCSHGVNPAQASFSPAVDRGSGRPGRLRGAGC